MAASSDDPDRTWSDLADLDEAVRESAMRERFLTLLVLAPEERRDALRRMILAEYRLGPLRLVPFIHSRLGVWLTLNGDAAGTLADDYAALTRELPELVAERRSSADALAWRRLSPDQRAALQTRLPAVTAQMQPQPTAGAFETAAYRRDEVATVASAGAREAGAPQPGAPTRRRWRAVQPHDCAGMGRTALARRAAASVLEQGHAHDALCHLRRSALALPHAADPRLGRRALVRPLALRDPAAGDRGRDRRLPALALGDAAAGGLEGGLPVPALALGDAAAGGLGRRSTIPALALRDPAARGLGRCPLLRALAGRTRPHVQRGNHESAERFVGAARRSAHLGACPADYPLHRRVALAAGSVRSQGSSA